MSHSSCPWHSPGNKPGVGGHSLLQGIFPTQGSNPGWGIRVQSPHPGVMSLWKFVTEAPWAGSENHGAHYQSLGINSQAQKQQASLPACPAPGIGMDQTRQWPASWPQGPLPPTSINVGLTTFWRSLVGHSPWGGKKLDTTEWLTFIFHFLASLPEPHQVCARGARLFHLDLGSKAVDNKGEESKRMF